MSHPTLKQRIKQAYLSDKNVESCYELLMLGLQRMHVDKLYPSKILFTFLRSMMEYVASRSDQRLDESNMIADPKKTVVLLNYIAIKKTTTQIQEQCRKYKGSPSLSKTVPIVPNPIVSNPIVPNAPIPPRLLSIPTRTMDSLHDERVRQMQFHHPVAPRKYPVNNPFGVSAISIEELSPKKKNKSAISIKALQKDEFELHDWWKRPFYNSEPTSSSEREMENAVPTPPPPPPPVWKLVNIRSVDRDRDKYPSQSHYVAAVDMRNVCSIYLQSIDIRLHCNTVTDDNNVLYYSEDDEPMKTISIPAITGDNVQDVLDFCSDLSRSMTEASSTYRYEIVLNRHTKRLKIVQLPRQEKGGGGGGGEGKLHLYFEQTRRNCGNLLGFGSERDYRDRSEYDAPYEHRLDSAWDGTMVHLKIPELDDAPIISFPNRSKKYEFENLSVSQYVRANASFDELTIALVDSHDRIMENISGDHDIVLRCHYRPFLPPARDEKIPPHKHVDSTEPNKKPECTIPRTAEAAAAAEPTLSPETSSMPPERSLQQPPNPSLTPSFLQQQQQSQPQRLQPNPKKLPPLEL